MVAAGIVLLAVGIVSVVAMKTLPRANEAAEQPGTTHPTPSPTAPSLAALSPEQVLSIRSSDWLAIVTAINEIRTKAYREARPELFDQIYSTACPCNADGKKALTDALSQGQRVGAGFGPRILQADALESAGATDPVAFVRVIHEQTPYDILDAAGNLLKHSEGWTPEADIWNVAWDADGPWRLSSLRGEGKATRLADGRWGPPKVGDE
jgi:hypothetical protein